MEDNLQRYVDDFYKITMDHYEQQLLRMAIVKIHCNAEYYEGMEILCKLAEWGDLLNPYYTEEERAEVKARFNRWVRDLRQRVDICRKDSHKLRKVK